jgi:hypothetical protein
MHANPSEQAMKQRSPIRSRRLVIETSLSLLLTITCTAGLLGAALFLPLHDSVPLLVACIVGPILLFVLWRVFQHREAIWGKPIVMEDLVFGRIRYAPNRKMPDRGVWCCVQASHFGNRLEEVEDFIIYADEQGPTEDQRQVFGDLLERFDNLALEIEEFLYADYLKWCDIVRKETGNADLEQVPGFPLLANSREAYNSASFSSLEVTSKSHERGPNCEVYLYICVNWDEEHNRAVFIKDAKLCDYDVV